MNSLAELTCHIWGKAGPAGYFWPMKRTQRQTLDNVNRGYQLIVLEGQCHTILSGSPVRIKFWELNSHTEFKFCYLYLRMARVEKNRNLKWLANVFKFGRHVFQESSKFTMDSSWWQISFDVLFWFIKNFVASQGPSFVLNYKLWPKCRQWQCPFKLVWKRRGWYYIVDNSWQRTRPEITSNKIKWKR